MVHSSSDRDRPADDRDETSDEGAEDDSGGFFAGSRFGVDLGTHETAPIEVVKPDVTATSPSEGHKAKSLTERLAEAADDRERASAPTDS